jgi:D-inositol-3-phosphate glycosyltransferase
MKILMVPPSYAPILGGTETCVRELSVALRRRRHHVDILTLNMDEKWKPRPTTRVSDEDGRRVFRWGARNPVEAIRTPWLNRLAKRGVDSRLRGLIYGVLLTHFIPSGGIHELARQYDVVHCHDEVDLTFPILLHPHIMQLHTVSETFPAYRASPLLRYLLCRCAEYWVANSADSMKRATELGVPHNRINVVHNGVDPQVFSPSHSYNSFPVILFVGRLSPRKGLKVLLDALDYLTVPATVQIVGGTADKEYERRVRERIHQLTTRGLNVRLCGPLSGPELVEAYKNADIFVCPSLIEPFGIVVVEAMSCGVPVVASRVDGLLDIVEDGVNGLFFEAGNAQELVACIEPLLKDENLREKLGRNARETVLARFTWDNVAEQIERVYGFVR